MQSLGRYEIIEQLGAGAMGSVYKARDPMMGRDVAIKTILSHAIEGPQSAEFRERFFREAQAAGRLAHPGIVTMYDVAEHEGTPFLVMEYVAGRTLQSVLESERLDMDRVYDFGIQIAEALDYAHRNGVIHRDIKPANILITPDGRVKVADFGVARLNDSQVTTTGQLLGTPSFMAPEQFTGMGTDGRADLFAAGVVVYWMATGDKPFTGDTILAVQYKVVHTDPVPPRRLNPAISRELEAAILKGISKDPAGRYQSGQQFAADLRAAQAAKPLSTKTVIIGSKEASTPVLSGSAPTVLTTASRASAKQPTMISARRDAAPSVLQTSELGPQKKRLFAILLVALVLFGIFSIPRRVGLRGREVPSPVSDVDSSSAPPSEETRPSADPQPEVAASVASTKELAPPISKPEAAEPDTIALGISALENTNIVFRAAGQPTESLAMAPGESATLRAEKEGTLIVSNTAALQAKLNGKPLSFGPGQRAGEFLITPHGIDESRSVIGASGAPSSPSSSPAAPAPPPQADSSPAARDARNIGSLPRQLELIQTANSVRLVVKSPAIPEFVTVIVRADNEVLFRREATALPPEGFEEGLRRFEGAVSTIPLSEERLLPPGSHTLDVTILLGRTRLGQTQEITAEFSPKDRRSLLIQFAANPVRAGQRGAARFSITLD